MADRALEVSNAAINALGAGLWAVIPAVAGYRVRLVGLVISSDATAHVTFQDSTTSLLDLYLLANVPIVLPGGPAGWLSTAASEKLDLSVNGAANVHGRVIYQMVPNAWGV